MRYLMHATPTLAVLAIAAFPTFAQAQQAAASAQPNPAAEHLAAARSALNKVLNAPAPTGDAYKKLTEIKTQYIALERAASTASPEWAAHYRAIDQLVGDLVGAPSAEPGAVGTSGRAGAAGVKPLDPAIASNLQAFRTHLSAFSTAMAAVAPPPSSQPAPAAAAPPVAAPPAAAPSADAPPAAAPVASDDVVAQLDQVMALVNSALATNAQATTGALTIDRATLEQIKTQLEQIKQSVKKQ